jgi:hypothetical protein
MTRTPTVIVAADRRRFITAAEAKQRAIHALLDAERRRTPPVPKRREQEIQRAILDLLHARGVLAWKAGSGAFRVQAPGQRERYVRMGHAGVADIIGVFPMARQSLVDGTRSTFGRFLAIEVKTETGAVTPAQQAFLDAVSAAGGLAVVARSVDDVARALGWA